MVAAVEEDRAGDLGHPCSLNQLRVWFLRAGSRMHEVKVQGGAAWLPFKSVLNPDRARLAAARALGPCMVTSCPLVCSTRKGHGHPGAGGEAATVQGMGCPTGCPIPAAGHRLLPKSGHFPRWP